MTATADATDRSTVTKLAQAVKDLQETVEQQDKRIDELEDELAEYRNHNERDKAEIRQKITGIENRATEVLSADTTPGVKADEPQSQTPLERICSLPHNVADRELTANQERARFIAQHVRDYAEKTPAGLVIDSRAVKRVITASEGKRPHTQTVARVMNFLDELGKDAVELKKRRGKKFVVVDPEAADRLATAPDHDCGDGGSDPAHPERVIPSG